VAFQDLTPLVDFGLLLRYYLGLIKLFIGGIYDKKN